MPQKRLVNGRHSKVSGLLTLTPGDAGTNPFDFRDLRDDIERARTRPGEPDVAQPEAPGQGGGGPSGPGGAVNLPLTLVGFLPADGEAAGNGVQIDAFGTDTITFRAAPDGDPALPATAIAVDVTTPTTTATFTAGTFWTIVTRSHANPVSDAVSPSFVVRRLAGGDFYRVQLSFDVYNPAGLQFRVTALSGVRCGPAASDCP